MQLAQWRPAFLCSEESTISMLAGIMIVQFVIGTLALVGLTIWAPVVPDGADGFPAAWFGLAD